MRVKLPLYIVSQQARWKKSKAKRTKGQFKLFYHGVDIKKNGEGIILKKEYVNSIVEVKSVRQDDEFEAGN